MILTNTLLTYILTVFGVTVLVLVWGLYRLRSAEKIRLKNINKMEVTEAIGTEASDEDTESITRNRAVTSISGRFNNFRLLFVPSVLLVASFFIFMPLLTSISATYISLFAGAIAVIIGLAAKPLIENTFAGFVITIFQPLRIGDTIIVDKQYGTVETINSLYTVIKVWNWRRYIIPNHRLLQKEFENLSKEDEQEWAHVEFSVAPGSDIELVKSIAKKAMSNRFLLKIEAPSFWVTEMKENAIICWIAGWASSPSEAWALKSTTRKELVQAFREAEIQYHMSNNKLYGPSYDPNIMPPMNI